MIVKMKNNNNIYYNIIYMNISEIYKRKNNKPHEIYRNMISIYYYLLLNNKLKNFIKYLLQFKIKYINFFRNNFINNNIFFFLLYNKIPNIFLPLPDKYYYKYPIITFSNNVKSTQHKLNLSLPKNKKLLNNNYYHFTRDTTLMSNYEYINSLKYIENNIYDYFNIIHPINYLLKLNSGFFNNKSFFIIYNNNNNHEFIITDSLKINNNTVNNKPTIIIIENYYVKTNKFKLNNTKLEINLNDILYLSILDNITSDKVYKVFPFFTIPKDTILYNQINKNNKYFNYNLENKGIPNYYTLNKIRILDPLYIEPKDEYYIKQFKVINDIKILNISTNIYLDNEIVRNYYKISKDYKVNCLKIDTNSKRLCEFNIYKPEKNNYIVNYNKRLGISLLIWKNIKYMDNYKSFSYFFKELQIYNYFNIFSTIITKDNQEKLLGEELFISDPNILKNIIPIDNYKFIDLSLKQ